MVQLKYFGDSRDYFKYDLITAILEDRFLDTYTFIPMLTDHRDDNEGNKKPAARGDKSPKLYNFIVTCEGRTLDHWETWLTPHVLRYNTLRPADEIFFRDECRVAYWQEFRPLVEVDKALVFIDPDTGLQTGTSSYRKRMGPEKYILDRELKDIYGRLQRESIVMVYQHLPRNKRSHGDATRKKLAQAQFVCQSSFACAYREDDLAFVLIAKCEHIFERMRDLLIRYYARSKDRYKELHQLQDNAMLDEKGKAASLLF
jgi:hypothetical protein